MNKILKHLPYNNPIKLFVWIINEKIYNVSQSSFVLHPTRMIAQEPWTF
jgi:hypothetical protein